MKKNIYLSIFIIFFIIFLGLFPRIKIEAQECPIQTIGLSRDTYNDLKSDPNVINEVKSLQSIFSKIPNIGWKSNYQITGSFGYGTEGLLRRFQKAYGLNSTGIIDEATKEKLCQVWEYQNRQTTTGGAGGTSTGGGATGSSGGNVYTPQGGEGGGTSLKTCVYNVWSLDPAYCKGKPYCCVKNTTYVTSNQPCPVDMCQSDEDYTGNYLNDPDFWDEFNKGIIGTSQSKFKICKPKKCTESGCVPSFVGYVRKTENCPADLCIDDKQCSSDYKKCIYDDCILVIPKEQKYNCETVVKYVKKTESCPAGVNCKTSIYGCDNYGTTKHTCLVKKCENKGTLEGKCKEEKVLTYEPCDTLKSECINDSDCKLLEKYVFNLDKCECIKDQTNGTLTLSECELKKAEAIQKQQGGCKGQKPSEDWLKNIDCSLGHYSGSQPSFECEQKLGCKWCPECIYPSQQVKEGMFTGYIGGKCIKINEPCEGKYVVGKCNAKCATKEDCMKDPNWRNNCTNPSTCEAYCYYGQCSYDDKNFREICNSAKTRDECVKIGSCVWIYECRPYRPTWAYVGHFPINTCQPPSGYQMTENDYKCVKGKCGAECDDDSDCGPGNKCNPYCKCVSNTACIGDSDLGNPFEYGECRNGTLKNPSNYIWKDRCDGPKILIEATLTDSRNCQCGHQEIDCSKLLVNGICQDGKCVSSTGGEKTYCGCKDFQKICTTEAKGGGNIGEKIECRPGSEASCPSCVKSCWWYKCEKNEKGEYRCKQYYEEKISKEKPCPLSDDSCADGVINKLCSPPSQKKCTDYGANYKCISKSDANNKCKANTIKTDIIDCDKNTEVCCEEKTSTPNQYSKCDITSYSIGGQLYYTWRCISTSDPSKDDKCSGKIGQELIDYCTAKYGSPTPPPPTPSPDTGCQDNKSKIEVKQTKCDYSNCPASAFNLNSFLAYFKQLFLAGTTPPVQNGICKTVGTVMVCPEDKDKVIPHECDYNTDCPCPTSSGSGKWCEECSLTLPCTMEHWYDPAGKCDNESRKNASSIDKYPDDRCVSLCSSKKCKDGECTSSTSDKCSNYASLGYQCVLDSGQSCESDTNKGQLDCPQNYVCCKMKDSCFNYALNGYDCYSTNECKSGTSKGQLDCSSGKVCCVKETTTSDGEWCQRCSTISPCTKVKWYDRTGGCDDDWYNQRTTWVDDTCTDLCSSRKCENGQCK